MAWAALRDLTRGQMEDKNEPELGRFEPQFRRLEATSLHIISA